VDLGPPAPTPPVVGTPSESGAAPPAGLREVLESVERHFPLVLAAQQEVALAEAELLRARGGFDTRLSAGGASKALGYYQNEELDLQLSQPTRLWGATFSGGYRLGTGDFAVYDGYDQTNDGGELRLGLKLPLLQGRELDSRRVAEWRAEIARERAEPLVVQKRLEVQQKAADAYWRWVSWCRSRDIARLLLSLAENRQAQVVRAVEEGQQAPIAVADNERTIVDRRSKLIYAERNLEKAAIELSLYWRDARGWPVVPSLSVEAVAFPPARDPGEVLVPEGVELALSRRPELRVLELELEALALDRELAINDRLPELDFGLKASQDLGAAVKDPDDRGDLELQALVTLQVPLQRRAATGKQREAEAKLSKLERELQYRRDLARTAVQDAESALRRSWERLGEARRNVELAGQLAEAERVQFRAGESDLFRVNLREQQAALAAAGEVEVLEDHFRAIARYRAVLGVPHEGLP
jgi:outer membrane protein TolC